MKNYNFRLTALQIEALEKESGKGHRNTAQQIRLILDERYGLTTAPKEDKPVQTSKPLRGAANGSYGLKDNETFVRYEGSNIVYKDEFGVFRRKKAPN